MKISNDLICGMDLMRVSTTSCRCSSLSQISSTKMSKRPPQMKT